MIKTRKCILENQHPEIDLDNWQEIANLMANIFNAASGDIVQLRDGEFNVVRSSNNEDNFLAANSSWPWDIKGFCRRMVETGESLYIGDAANSLEWKDAPPVTEGPVRSYLGYPLYWPNGDVFGSICVIDTKPTHYSDDYVTLLGQLKKLIEANLRHADDLEQLKYTAHHDHLTGCGNRLLMDQRLNDQLTDAQTFSLVSIDLDDFKPVNDAYGHQVGDTVLKEVASRLQSHISDNDLLVRTGGDEFLIIYASEINVDQTFDKLTSVFDQEIDCGEVSLRIAASFGSANYPKDGSSIDALMTVVDQRMYSNKKAKKLS